MYFGARCHDYPKTMPEELFAAIAADGFTTVQLAPKKALPAEVAEDTPRLAASLAAAGLSVGVYGCYVELGMADAEKRAAAVAAFRTGIARAKMLCAGCIGSETTKRETQPGVPHEKAIAALERSLSEILPLAEETGMLVAVEPVFYHTLNTPELTRQLLDTMQSPNLRVVFDPVNLLDVPDLAPERQAAMWQRAATCFGDKIAAVHMKGITAKDGALDACPLEDSALDAAGVFAMLRQLGYNGPVFREQVVPEHAKADIAQLRRLADGENVR